MTALAARRPIAGESTLHPVSLAAIAVLVLNDHWWKAALHNTLTGKLSDFAGLVFFPLFLAGAWEIAASRRDRPCRPTTRAIVIAVAATAIVFTAVKLVPAATDVYRWGLAALQWPFLALRKLASAGALPRLRPVSLVRDTTDLFALPTLVVPFGIGIRRVRLADMPSSD